MADVSVIQQLPFQVRVIRWWASVTIWIQIWSFVELALPILMVTDLSTLGLDPRQVAWAVIVMKLVNVAGTIAQRNKTANVVGSKKDVEAASAAPLPIETIVPTPAPQP